MRPSGSQSSQNGHLPGLPRGSGSVAVRGGRDNVPSVHFQGMTSPGLLPSGATPRDGFIPPHPNSQPQFGKLQGIPLPSFSATVAVQDPMSGYRSYQTGHPSVIGGTTGGINPVRYPPAVSQVSADSPEERKRLAQQRQQAKMRQSFEASKNKSLKPDDLMGQIIADFGSTTVPVKNPSVSATLPNQREAQSRPETPRDSPVMSSQRDRSGSLNLSPQSSARARSEPASDPISSVSGPTHLSNQRTRTADISDLMEKFSDLSSSTSSPRHNFAPLPVKHPQPVASAKPTAFYNASQSAVDWSNISHDLSSSFTAAAPSGPGGNASVLLPPSHSDLPPWCSNVDSLPQVYRSVLQYFRNQPFMAKAPILAILSRSGLGNTTLDHIWKATCRTKEDGLSRAELCAALGLVGLAQTSFDVQHLSIDVLRRIPNPPEPSFIMTAPQDVQPVIPQQQPWPTVAPLFSHSTFQDIDLSFPVLQKQTSTPSLQPQLADTDEEFADFVSAAPNHHVTLTAPVKQSHSEAIFPAAKPEHKARAAPLEVRNRKKSESSSIEQGWGDWAQPEIAPPPVRKPAEAQVTIISASPAFVFRPETVGRSVAQPFASLPVQQTAAVALVSAPSLPTASTDPYAALRELSLPATVDNKAESSHFDMLNFDDIPTPVHREGSSQKPFSLPAAAAAVDSASGDELSLQSLEFGMSEPVTGQSDCGDVNGGPSLVLDRLDFGGVNANEAVEPETAELTHVEAWTRALRACSGLLEEACGVFNSVDDSVMLTKVTAKATEHIENLIEVYRVARRIYIGAKSSGLIGDQTIVDAIKNTEEAWTDFTTFLSMAAVELPPGAMDFAKADLSAQNPPPAAICGVCLLDVDAKSRSRKSATDGCKIEHEGRFYHAACANFWVHCVEDRLPSLTYSH